MNRSNLFVLVAMLAVAGAAHSEVGATSAFPDLALPITGSPGQIIIISNHMDGAVATRRWVWLTNGESANWELLETSENTNYNTGISGSPDNTQGGDYTPGSDGGGSNAEDSDYNPGSSGGVSNSYNAGSDAGVGNAEVPSSYEANFNFPDLTLPDLGVPGQVITISRCTAGETLSQQWKWIASDENTGWQLISVEAEYNANSDLGRQNDTDVEPNVCDE